jgi:hypothetical protein
MTRLRRTGVVLAGGALLFVADGCRVHTELAASCVSYPSNLESTGTIVVEVDAPPKVAPGETFTVTVDDLSVLGVGNGDSGPQFPNGVLSVTGPVAPSGDVAVGEDVLTGGTPLPNTLTYTVTGSPGDTIRIQIETAQSFYGDFLHGQRWTCDGQGRQLAVIQVADPTA